MQCANCKAELREDDAFCSKCGARVAVTQSVQTAQDNAGVAGAIVGDHTQVGGVRNVLVVRDGDQTYLRDLLLETPALNQGSALERYLRYVLSQNRYLQLQGIRSGGKLVHIELEQIYVILRASRQRTVEAEEAWLEAEARLAPGEEGRPSKFDKPVRSITETVTVSVNEALQEHLRLVVLGDPGSGKTTLLRYLAMLYARDLAEGTTLVRERLGLDESNTLPILIPLRRLAEYLKDHAEGGIEGHARLMDHLYEMLRGERVRLPAGFFDSYLDAGRAVVLLDGLDEVSDPDLRRRVSRIVEAFTAAYPRCRYVVSSRIVGYQGAARLGEGYVTTTVRDFTLADVERFLRNWHLAVAVGEKGPGESAAAYAEEQTRQLLAAIQTNERMRTLAINPLMLTVIALVHRERVKLPDRRAELYEEAVNVLLGKWDEARGIRETLVLEDRPFEVGDRKLMLQAVAFWMHERGQKEIEVADLRELLQERFCSIVGEPQAAGSAVDRFLGLVQERTGLLGEHGVGVYRFSHLTFQEYLAALAVAARDDYVTCTLARLGDANWREVILLEAGYFSAQSRERTTRLIRAIADCKDEPEPYHNLVLAAECLRDVGPGRVEGDLQGEIQRRLQRGLRTRLPYPINLVMGKKRRHAAAQALARIGETQYWMPPYGEPEWVEVPAGEFWMGGKGLSDGKPIHRVYLEAFAISRTLVTNAQYRFFVEAAGHVPPGYWEEGRPPKGRESHPVTNVSWHDAMAYCHWLSEVTGKSITLPSEAEWEKAASWEVPSQSSPLAKGTERRYKRIYPWGNTFDSSRCNCYELGLDDTTPVGVFLIGASPYGVLDMAGNAWEWTRSLYSGYPYDPGDGREDMEVDDEASRVVRGGLFNDFGFIRCAYRRRGAPDPRYYGRTGFRVVVSGASCHPVTVGHAQNRS